MMTFGLPPKKYPDFDTEAICSEDFSDLTPLHGSEVAFGTLDWRPGAIAFEMRSDLQVRNRLFRCVKQRERERERNVDLD